MHGNSACCTFINDFISPDKRTGFYLEARVSNGYYNAEDVPLNFVNVSLGNCTPRGNFSNCVSAVHNQGCNNQFASAACPGIANAMCTISIYLYDLSEMCL